MLGLSCPSDLTEAALAAIPGFYWMAIGFGYADDRDRD
jgi:hypothetical protein